MEITNKGISSLGTNLRASFMVNRCRHSFVLITKKNPTTTVGVWMHHQFYNSSAPERKKNILSLRSTKDYFTLFLNVFTFSMLANIWCPKAETTLMRVVWGTSFFLVRWSDQQRCQFCCLFFLPLAGKWVWDKSSVARQGWASVLMFLLMRSLSAAQRLPITLSRPILFFFKALSSSTTELLFGVGWPDGDKERKLFYASVRLLVLIFWLVSSTNRSVRFWHQWLCCQTVEHNTRSYLIVNSKNKSIVLLRLRLHQNN